MNEGDTKRQLNRAKKTACEILRSAGYRIERASNDIYCVVAMRDAEWRAIKIGLHSIIECPWFLKEIKKLENLPCPDPRAIKKEIWLRERGVHNFIQYYWKDNRWFNEDGQIVRFQKK